jgi:DNA-binding FadR family transcriptional regulator
MGAVITTADGAPDDFKSIPLKRAQKTAELLARRIIDDISRRALKPGDMLPPEAAMLANYRVGRASLREALRVLEINGFVTLKPGPGGGPVVAAMSSDTFGRMSSLYFQFARIKFREVAQTRLVMEPLLARLAAENAGAEDVSELRQLADPRAYGSYVAAGSEFHRVVARIARNGILGLFANAVQDILIEKTTLTAHPEARRVGVFHEHEEIIAAIEAGNPDAAERSMRKHMQQFVDYLDREHPGLQDEIVGGRW